MKKIIIIALICFILISAAGLTYLNNVFLPKTAKDLIVKSIEKTTKKKATISSVRINIFKGFVLKDLIIYDNEEQVINVKEASCIFWFWVLIQKKIVIPSINFNSALIFLERRKDESFNLTELFIPKKTVILPPKAAQDLKTPSDREKPSAGFIIEVYRINIVDSLIKFRDQSLSESLSLDLNNVDLSVYLSLPGSLKFKGSAQSPGNLRPNIYLNGELKLPHNELKANFILKNIKPELLRPYYSSFGISVEEGAIDTVIALALKDSQLDLQCNIKASGVGLKKDALSCLFNSNVSVDIRYALSEGTVKYRGKSYLTDTAISGVDYVDKVYINKATFDFSDTEASSNDISAKIFDMPVSAKVRLSNFNDLKMSLDLFSDFDLANAQNLLKSRFNFSLPCQANGNAGISLSLFLENLSNKQIKLAGFMDIINASLRLDKADSLMQEISGRLEFTLDQLNAKAVFFRYQDVPYRLSISVKNFQLPAISLEVSSDELLLRGDLNINKSRVLIKSLSGKYLNSEFQASGSFDAENFNADLSGALAVALEDLSKPLVKFKEELQRASPKGKVDFKFTLNGDVRDIKSCSFDLGFLSPRISLYGFAGGNISGYYKQVYGIADIPSLSFDFYGGKVNISARGNLKSDNLPYSVNLSLQGVKIEELKMDTAAKAKDISGIVNGAVKLNGFSNDLSKLFGAGNLEIAKGKLWELDLFKGMGKLLFARDFANIVFYEGSCNFSLQDKYIFTDSLVLKSNMVYLSGRAKIGFDNSIDAALTIDIIDELVPLSGTLKDITTTVIGKSGKFATINITGTLKEPKYKFKPVVENIIRGIADTLKKAIGRKQSVE